jgi:class 3 adenylate cyclase
MRGEPVRGGLPDPGFEALPGLERARAILRGLVPRAPLSHLLGLRLTQVSAGAATMTMPASPWLQTPNGRVLYGSMAETAAWMAVLTGAPPGMGVHTTTVSVSFFRPCTPESESVIARARTLNTGPGFTHTEVVMEDALGRLMAHVVVASVLRPVDPPPPSPLERVDEPTYPTPDPHKRALPAGIGVVRREVFEAQDGVATLRRVFFEDLPRAPVLEIFGATAVSVETGRVRFEVPASEWLCGVRREVSPGVLADLGVMAVWGAVVAAVPAGIQVGMASGNMIVFTTLAADGRPFVVEGQVADREGDVMESTATVTDASGRRVAVARLTGLVQSSRAAPPTKSQTLLLTLLFTDLVDSTRRVEQLGDERWREVLGQHHALVRHQLEVSKGREVKTTGDGFLATFDSPAQAIDCARRIREGLRGLDVEVRVGIHTGQCDVSEGDVSGIAVHVASRVLSIAAPGEVLVSGTVRDLLLGSDVKFEDRGRHQLKGIEGDWQLFSLQE